jgi:xylulokinase
MALFVGLDIGTTTSKAILLDSERNRVVHTVARPTPVHYPGPGLSEHDPSALWQMVCRLLHEVAAAADGQRLRGLAISSMADTGLLVDANHTPLGNIVTWYDRRCAPQVVALARTMTAERFHQITGQRFSTSLGIGKLLWLREQMAPAVASQAHWLSIPDFLLFCLTGVRVTDFSIASRTGLFDQQHLTWSDEVLCLSNLQSWQLPTPLPSGSWIGQITAAAARDTGVHEGTDCYLAGHDHLCAAFAAGAIEERVLVDSSGTAQSLLVPLRRFDPTNTLMRAGYAQYVHVAPSRYILRGGLRAAGGAIQWLAGRLSGQNGDLAALPYDELEAEASLSTQSRSPGPLWMPHFMGSGTPLADADSLAALIGLRAEHSRGDLFRSLLEALAFWTRLNLETVERLLGFPMERVLLLSGTTRLKLLTQIKADVLDRSIEVPQIPEPSALGAALLAGMGAGYIAAADEWCLRAGLTTTVVNPEPLRARRYSNLYERVYLPLYGALQPVHHALASLDDELLPLPIHAEIVQS